MNKTKLKKININDEIFYLDERYELIEELVSDKYQDTVRLINILFFSDTKTVSKIINDTLKAGCTDDIAMVYFLTMALQNYGEFNKAEKILAQLYADNPSSLLARCAYANSLIFKRKQAEIPAIFGGDFDLPQICSERQLPLITFLHFVEIACQYYLMINDGPNFVKHFDCMMTAAPDHAIVQRMITNIKELHETN